jgi:hypothetical protein
MFHNRYLLVLAVWTSDNPRLHEERLCRYVIPAVIPKRALQEAMGKIAGITSLLG